MFDPVARLRIVGMAEGASFLALLFIAMPLKYAMGLPLAVRIVGMLHGVLFLAYCVVLADAARAKKWPAKRTLGLFVAALLPFGPFVVDKGLKREPTSPAPHTGGEGG
jgi:integral membrane protein